MKYQKIYTREYTLLTLCAWQEYQQKYLSPNFDWNIPPIIFDANGGLIDVYIEQSHLNERSQKVYRKMIKEPQYIKNIFEEYKKILIKAEEYQNGKRKLSTMTDLIDFYSLTVKGWLGYGLSYFIPTMENAPEGDKKLAMSFREKSDHFLEDNDRLYKKVLPKIFPTLKDLSLYIASHELKNIPESEILKKRKKHYVYFGVNKISINSFAQILEETKNETEREESNLKKITEIKGQIAMKGFAKGKVHIISRKKDIDKLKKGEILIATMTTPDYIPAMEKAIAFVTDEGGITCHAAIIAREMKKPCIIGTKIATQVLKDGDEIEVDADNGIIKILNK